MIKENKVLKYLLYAIGEIVLVIVGILIALQINSANQVKKDRLLEQQYYCRLLEDVEQDKEQIILLNNEAQERLKYSNELARLIQQPTPDITEVNLIVAKTQRGSGINFRANNVAYEDLKSGANLNLIKDIPLKGLINNYFKNTSNYASVVSTNGEYINELLVKMLNNTIEYGMVYGYLHFDKKGFDNDVIDRIMRDKPNNLSKPAIDYFYNISIFLIITHKRRVELYELINKEVDFFTAALKKKCS